MADELSFNLYPPRGSVLTEETVAGLVGQWTTLGKSRVRVVEAVLGRDGSARVRVQGGGLSEVVETVSDTLGVSLG